MYLESLQNLKRYCEGEGYSGWDNFDGLNSRIFKSSPLYKSKLLRLAWIQLFKRSPVNLRRITFVPKGENPKGLALFTSGMINSGDYAGAQTLLDKLKALSCERYSDYCWGYNFDWQSRGHLTTLGTPNIVATVFVANAFLDYFERVKDEECLSIAQSACDFYLSNLVLFEDSDSLCFGYIPGTDTRVHNVNMMAATLLARIYSITGDQAKLDISKKAMMYSMRAINPDYSWNYGENKHQGFIDNFHTGFNLVSLNDWTGFSGDHAWKDELKKAFEYYIENFWLEDGCPKYYNNSLFPIDIHCSAQGIITILKLNWNDDKCFELAKKIANWCIDNMQDSRGFFYYQMTKIYKNKISYMRWSQAWMFYALSIMYNYSMMRNYHNN